MFTCVHGNQPYMFCRNDSPQKYSLCLVLSNVVTHTHTHTHHTMGITSINISGEQLIYSVKNVFENNLVCRYLNNKT